MTTGSVALDGSPAAPDVGTLTASVVICAYTERRWDDVLEAVASVRAQTVAPREVVVVVDHNPALLERLRSVLAGVTVIPNTQSRGLSGARNSGTGVCSGDVVAYLDDDAVADPDWLANLLAGYADPDVIGTGGWIDPEWVAGRRAFFPSEFNWVVGCSYTGLPRTTAPVRNLIGASMSFRRRVIEEIGGFLPETGRTGDAPTANNEDTEFCIRARQTMPHGVILHEPAARIRHKVPAARTSWSYFLHRCYFEGVSKAKLAGMVGAEDGLSSERAHALRVLPRGIARGIGDTVRRRDPSGVARSAAIAIGLASTACGYAVGRVRGA